MNILDLVRAKKRRLYILKLLNDSTAYSADSFVLQELLQHLKIDTPHRTLVADLQFLEKNKLITTISINAGHSATITQDGQDVAGGLLEIDGIARPSPKSIKALEILNETFWEQ